MSASGATGIELIVELDREADAELLKECASLIAASPEIVQVRPLGRVGHSGSRLFVAWGYAGRKGRPRVVKVDDEPSIHAEAKAIRAASDFFPDLDGVSGPVFAGDRGAIVYPLFADTARAVTVTELRDIAYADLGSRDWDERLAGVVRGVYGSCCSTAHDGQRRPIELAKEYERYKRINGGADVAERKVAALLGDRLGGEVDFLGRRFRDPRVVREDLEGETLTSAVVEAVHGDLHPNNILLDDQQRPRLIDFAWAERGKHALKDFVLLECSLRFLLFPGWAQSEDQLVADELLLEEDGASRIEADVGPDYRDAYRRLGSLLRPIRQAARDAGGPGYDFSEYLVSQFLVLFGLLKYDEYRLPYALRALGLIGSRARP